MMNTNNPARCRWTLSVAVWLAAVASGFAGHEISGGRDAKATAETKEQVEAHVRTWFPDFPPGFITAGVQFSEHLTGAYIDSVTGLWSPRERDAFLFLNSRYHYEDNDQFISSAGLGFRKMVPGQEIIIGANAYRDSIHSEHGNDFDQLGLGFEVLSHWVDARFNYYLPESDRYEVDRFSRRERDGEFHGGNFFQTTRTSRFKTYEAALEGFNAEIGFLIPGLDRFAEVRVFGGYYHYLNPFGGDFDGFKARLEARVLPGVMLDLEYWDDAALMGGHWTAGARVSVPFSIYNLVTGRNPFEGIGEQFTFRQREFKERLGEMVIRSHRVQTTTSGPRAAGSRSETETFRGVSPGGIAGRNGEGFPPE
jgi:hypothetical protein